MSLVDLAHKFNVLRCPLRHGDEKVALQQESNKGD